MRAALLFALVFFPLAASAQEGTQPSWAIVPLLGFDVVRNNGQWGSAGAEAALELEYGGRSWRASGSGAIRGLGVGCSERCFEDGGPALGLGAARSVGALWIGGGAAVMRNFGDWQWIPYARISLDALPLRFDLRIELPQDSAVDVSVPILIGFPIGR